LVIAVIYRHRLAGNIGLPPQNAGGTQRPARFSASRGLFGPVRRQRDVGPLTLNDQDLMLQAALDGLGLAYVFEAQAAELIKQKKLVRVLADWCPAYPGFFLYYPSRRQLPAALRAFIDFAREAA
jgi:DNA-binding transcriptional LysR family regulator